MPHRFNVLPSDADVGAGNPFVAAIIDNSDEGTFKSGQIHIMPGLLVAPIDVPIERANQNNWFRFDVTSANPSEIWLTYLQHANAESDVRVSAQERSAILDLKVEFLLRDLGSLARRGVVR